MDAGEYWRRLERLQSTLESGLAQLEELRLVSAELKLPERPLPECPECGPVRLPKGVTVADHRRNVHGVDDD